MDRAAVINVVGLTESLLGPLTPNLNAYRDRHFFARIEPAFPAVTCTAQSNYLTGALPTDHGIVGNGWYDRPLAEVQFWKQSNHLVHGKKVWEQLKQKHPGFTCAKLFWWYNMYSSADYSITPRPIYPADGRKVFDIYSYPASIHGPIKQDLGPFPFPTFWGPAAGVDTPQGPATAATQWIADSARWIEERYKPDLSLIYLPHLDYNLQRYGPNSSLVSKDIQSIDQIVGDLLAFFQSRSVQPLILSEYGITEVDRSIHLNRLFRQEGWITIKDELGLERLDCGASRAFAVADHQIAHVYINDPAITKDVSALLSSVESIDRIADREAQVDLGIAHARSGDLIVLAKPNAWFTYYYWLKDAAAPDFARCVDIHRKPGYDPVELFLDPNLRFPRLKIGLRLLQKKIGLRTLMDVIPLDSNLIKGSHGVPPGSKESFPILISPQKLPQETIASTLVSDCIQSLFQ